MMNDAQVIPDNEWTCDEDWFFVHRPDRNYLCFVVKQSAASRPEVIKAAMDAYRDFSQGEPVLRLVS